MLRDREGARLPRSLRAWLFQVARNLCLNRLRSHRREARALEKEAEAPTPADALPDRALEQGETREALSQSVARLPVELAEVYQLRSGGMSYAEIAEVLEIPLGTVKSRMHQMVSRLREEIHR